MQRADPLMSGTGLAAMPMIGESAVFGTTAEAESRLRTADTRRYADPLELLCRFRDGTMLGPYDHHGHQ